MPFRRLGAWASAIGVVAAGLACRNHEPIVPGGHAIGGAAPRPASLLLVSVDTLRADRVGRGLTPAIDALGAAGQVFTHTRTVAPLTLPAHVSLLTSVRPPVHGVRENGTYVFDGRVPSLAVLLKDAGFDTAAFVGSYVLNRRFGLGAGFDVYDDDIARGPRDLPGLDAERRGEVVADRAISWLRQRALQPTRDRPFFAWVHFWDPHAPYDPPGSYRARAGGDAYNGEIAYVDAQLARLVRALDETGERFRTLVVVVGDHGESLGEHGERTHGMLLFESALLVPLVVCGPGVRSATRNESASILDVAPTVLAALGLAVPDSMEGVNLLAGPAPADREHYAETEYPRVAGWSRLYSLSRGRWKLVAASASADLFDLTTDPVEARDASAHHGATARAMEARLGDLRRAAGRAAGAAAPPSPEVAARLRALGYVAPVLSPARAGTAAHPAGHIGEWCRFEEALGDLAAGRPATAAATLRRLVAAHPGATLFRSLYARALEDSGDLLGALAVLREAAARHPGDAALLHEFADVARRAGRGEEALRAERASLAVDPGNPAASNGLGVLLVEAGRFDEALVALGEAVEHDPTNAGYWTNLGNARRESGDAGLAAEAYRQALAIDSTHPDASNGLGVLLVRQGRAHEAIPLFERALSVEPGFTEARLNLGIAHHEAGRLAEAAAAYEAVLASQSASVREKQSATQLLADIRRRLR